MSLRDELRPTGRNRVIDLVQAAGVDVSDWSNSTRGAKYASVNPKYCYNWSFIGANGTVVLSLWFRNITERRGVVSVETNLRALSDELKRRGSKSLWIERAKHMDDAISFAAAANARVREIVNDGDMRDIDDPEAKASVVRGRMLDPMPWTITQYDKDTGACRLRRGTVDRATVDQFSIGTDESNPTEQVDASGKRYARNPDVRRAVLSRAAGRCEFCGMPGFMMASGQFFLETHHIVPFSEEGGDVATNVSAVCPNHHREAHYGASAPVIRDFLLSVAGKMKRSAV